MGNCGGSGDKRSKQIDREQRAAELLEQTKIRILLLGAGESGKTTLFKQLKLLYSPSREFTDGERMEFMKVIAKNVLVDMSTILRAHEDLRLKFVTSEASEAADKFAMIGTSKDKLSPADADMFAALWADESIQHIWQEREALQVQDAFEYFMNNIKRICLSTWSPTNQDILRARQRTTGVVKAEFTISRTRFEMYDVGGQRTERKKWIHYFDGVTTVLFVAAISEYNQVLYEDAKTNRQDEAVELFKQQLLEPLFQKIPFILFLNKKDLFREKLTKVPFKLEGVRNDKYMGPKLDLSKTYNYLVEDADKEFEAYYRATLTYLTQLYLQQAPPSRASGSIYVHPTNSTDTQNIENIMNSSKDIILKDHLVGGGWA